MNDSEHEIFSDGTEKKAKQGLGPNINFSTMAWNFEVKSGTQSYLSCTKNQLILRRCKYGCFIWHGMTLSSIGCFLQTINFSMPSIVDQEIIYEEEHQNN